MNQKIKSKLKLLISQTELSSAHELTLIFNLIFYYKFKLQALLNGSKKQFAYEHLFSLISQV
jgi:hypothetical protein